MIMSGEGLDLMASCLIHVTASSNHDEDSNDDVVCC